MLPEKQLASQLAQLASRAPPDLPEVRDRLVLKALAAASDVPARERVAVPGARAVVNHLLDDPPAARLQTDMLTGSARDIVTVLAPSAGEQRELASRWDAALVRLGADGALSNGAKLDALDGRVSLWKLTGAVTPPQRHEVLVEVARIVAATTDRYERQAVVPAAAHVLREAGLIDESDELLTMELPRAVAPYYHMLGLAANAKARNDNAQALKWYEQAWRRSEGPATRLQWGASYVKSLIALAPQDTARIEQAAHEVLAELRPDPETFFERNERALSGLSKALRSWAGDQPARRKVVAALQQQLASTCAKLPAHDAGHSNCTALASAS